MLLPVLKQILQCDFLTDSLLLEFKRSDVESDSDMENIRVCVFSRAVLALSRLYRYSPHRQALAGIALNLACLLTVSSSVHFLQAILQHVRQQGGKKDILLPEQLEMRHAGLSSSLSSDLLKGDGSESFGVTDDQLVAYV